MPIFEKNDIKILHIHIPKTAGMSLRKVLINNSWKHSPLDEKDCQCNEVHFHYAELASRFNLATDFSYIFSVVRHPYYRAISEYIFREGPPTPFNDWYGSRIEEYFSNPFVEGNHIRPQHEFIGKHVNKVYRFENNIQKMYKDLEKTLHVTLKDKGVWLHRATKTVDPKTVDFKMLYDFYRKDFELFGYDSYL